MTEKQMTTAPTGGFNLTPKTFEEAEKFAKLISDSEMVPRDYKGKPGNVLVAVQMGAELGVHPMQALQNIAVINGRPSIYGDLGKALLQRGGCRIEIDDIDVVKKTGKGRCRIERDNMPPVERTFGIDDAKLAKLWGKQGPWTDYPYRQLSWRAFWFAARDAAADLLKGFSGIEEVQDIPPEAPPVEMPRRRSEAEAKPEPKPEPKPEAVQEAEVVKPKVDEAFEDPAKAERKENTFGENMVNVSIQSVTFEKTATGFAYTITDDEGVPYFTTQKAIASGLKKMEGSGKPAILKYRRLPTGINELVSAG